MDKKIGFIGAGNMAKAMITGIVESGLTSPENIIASSRTKETIENISKELNIKTTLNNNEVAKFSDYLILAVKPYQYDEILKEIKNFIKEDTIIIIIAAGISIDYLKRTLGENHIVVKSMPNTPATVREAMTALAFDNNINEKQKKEVISIFESFGKIEELDENLMDGFTAIAGSSPAYVYMMIEAMADGGVLQGIPREKAYMMAAQAVLGAAKVVLDTGLHPGILKDKVSSPGGTTIEAVAKLEEKGFRSSIIEAMRVCGDKSKEMTKNN